jgi:hypothetical protein
MVLGVNFFSNQKWRDVTDCRNKNDFKYSVLSPCYNFYNNNMMILMMMMEDSQDPTLLLKIPMGTQKNFSENCRQFARALSKRFASPCRGQERVMLYHHYGGIL